MTARLLDGHAIADRLLADAAADAAYVRTVQGRAPTLAMLTAGAPAAAAYLRRIEQFAARATVETRLVPIPDDPRGAIACLDAANADPQVDGILILLPLPPAVPLPDLAAMLDPAKDVDGLTAANAGRLARGLAGLFPCTPQAAIRLAEGDVGDLRGATVTVVGASSGVGRPLAEMLVQRGATVTIAHVDTRDLAAACRTADVLFVAAGKPFLVAGEHVAPGATIIDIGINAVKDGAGNMKIVGDVDLAGVAPIAGAISAVPDGVGPITTAFLIRNVVEAAMRSTPPADRPRRAAHRPI